MKFMIEGNPEEIVALLKRMYATAGMYISRGISVTKNENGAVIYNPSEAGAVGETIPTDFASSEDKIRL